MLAALLLHLLGVVIWVGGMFFAYMALRPVAASLLEPPLRLRLWDGVFGRFFPWVSISIVLILVSGLYLIGAMGGFKAIGGYVHAMFALGLLMMLLYGHVYFAGYKRLHRLVAAEDWTAAGKVLARMRQLIGINLGLGLLVIVVAKLGPMLA